MTATDVGDRFVVREAAAARLPVLEHGEFDIKVFETFDGDEHVALTKPPLDADSAILVRLHSECLTGDVFGSVRCDCGEQLDAALALISAANGVLIYLRQEGRGIGLANKIKAYTLQEQGMDTVEANQALGFEADQREYHVAAQMLQQLGVRRIRLLTNNPRKLSGLASEGIEVVERIPLEIAARSENADYLTTKRRKLGHLLSGG